ncbi:MAG: hypothetical protein ACJAVI_000825 [Candidatus Azotimanducaceae bacterium]|jgi:hypothetical protein
MIDSVLASKVIGITQGRRRHFAGKAVMNHAGREMRQETRHSSHERLFVQVVECDDQKLIGMTVSCDSVDVSVGGLRISSETHIPEGSQVDLWIDVNSGPGKFFLTSDVRWSKTTNDGNYLFGAQLRDGAATDINEWRALQS